MRKNKQLPDPRRLGGEKWPSGGVFAGVMAFVTLVFCSVYLLPNSSQNMVGEAAHKVVLWASMCLFVLAAALYFWGKLLSRQDSLRVAGFALIVGVGTLFLRSFVATAGAVILYSFLVCLAFAAYWRSRRMLDLRRIALLVLVLGCVMRIAFAMAQPAYRYQHDTAFDYGFDTAHGHAQYIGILVNTGWLPQTNTWQLYHPPLFHIVAAVFYKFNELLGNDYFHVSENFQFLNALFSCLTLLVWYKILYALKFGRKGFLVAFSIMAFHPTFYFVGSCINNDCLMWLFVSLTILFLIRWMHKPGFVNILLMALSLGLGMMTKTSAVLLAPVIGIVLLARLIGSIRKKSGAGRLVGQYAVFGAVSIPLGIWYQIRNLIRFDQMLSHVPLPDSVTSSQYIGEFPLISRILPLDLSTLSDPYPIWEKGDYNLFIKMMKTSLFGETYRPAWEPARDWFAMGLSVANYLLVLLSFAAIVYVLVRCKKSTNAKFYWVLAGVYAMFTLSYIAFCLAYPWQCTLDARYIVVNICIGAVFLGKMVEVLLARAKNRKGAGATIGRVVAFGTIATAALFMACSMLIFVSEAFVMVF